MSEKVQEDSQDGDIEEARVEAMARDLAQHINSVPSKQREQLREMAVHLVRDEVVIAPPVDRGGERRTDAFNPFAIGIPLILAGGVLSILFPPVGLLLFAAAAVTMAWGVLSVLLSSGGN